MRYFDWNIVIGNYFFNYEKGGKDVHLFISMVVFRISKQPKITRNIQA